MKIFLTDQHHNFDQLLPGLIGQPVMKYDLTTLREKIDEIELPTKKSPGELDLDFLFNYKVFPPGIMSHRAQWIKEERMMKIGDTLLQQVFIPPLRHFSQKIIFGVRINAIFDEPLKRGYSYETLEGHVEKGMSIFTIEQRGGKTIFKIHSFSGPGTWLSAMMAPIFSLRYQAYCTRMALENVRREIA